MIEREWRQKGAKSFADANGSQYQSSGSEYQINADLLDEIMLELEVHYDKDPEEWDTILGLSTDLSGLEDNPDDGTFDTWNRKTRYLWNTSQPNSTLRRPSMKIIAGFAQIHSKYSRVCSQDLVPGNTGLWADKKASLVIGTGDFTHPGCWVCLKKVYRGSNRLYQLKDKSARAYFMLTAEVSSIYKQDDKADSQIW